MTSVSPTFPGKASMSFTIIFLFYNQILTHAFKENIPIDINITAKALLDDIIKEIDEYTLQNCILELERNEIDLAVITFTKLQDANNSLQTIIKQVYSKDYNNLYKLLTFVTKLPQCNHRYAGFEFLFHTLCHNHHWNTQGTFQFAYQVKKLLVEIPNCLHENGDMKMKENLINIKYKLPRGIRTIIWQHRKLCLKNSFFKEHLYPATCCRYDRERRRVFSWIPKGEIGAQGEFTFEPIKNASVFRIKSDYYQEHLYAAECCKYDNERRNVFTWIPKEDMGFQGEWTLELVNDSNLFRIRNNHYGEYLYAADCCYYNKRRRSVFTWIPKGDIGTQGEWEISSC